MLRVISFLTLFYLVCLGASAAHADGDGKPVWPNLHQWLEQVPADARPSAIAAGTNFNYEDLYSYWIEHRVNVDALATKYLPETDCKQAVVFIRIYFAAIYRLPFVMSVSSTNGSWSTISNSMTSLTDETDYAKRVFAFMKFVQPRVTLQGLVRDTYAIHIDNRNLRPGTVLLILAGPNKNHSLTVWTVDKALGKLEFINGTDEPYTVTNLTAKFLENTKHLELSAHPYKYGQDGFRAWRHLELPVTSERGYDPTDQYTEAFKTFQDATEDAPSVHKWQEAVEHRFNPNLDMWDEFTADLEDVKNLTENRAFVINNFETHRQNELGGQCLSGGNYDKAETRTRDSNILEAFNVIDAMLKRASNYDGYERFTAEAQRFLSQAISYGPDLNDPNRVLTLQEFKDHLQKGLASKNPNDTLDLRWGMPNASGEFDRPSTCPK